jgi:hypothetical protein
MSVIANRKRVIIGRISTSPPRIPIPLPSASPTKYPMKKQANHAVNGLRILLVRRSNRAQMSAINARLLRSKDLQHGNDRPVTNNFAFCWRFALLRQCRSHTHKRY